MWRFADRVIGMGAGWPALLVAPLFAFSQIHPLPEILVSSNGHDFRLIWLAGTLWTSGGDPYSFASDHLPMESFGPQPSSHFRA